MRRNISVMPANSYEKPDYWSQKAFSEGYPARSVYKLKEMDEKFGMIKKNCNVLDLGAAPGSWTTFLLRNLGEGGSVTSCDLNPLSKSVRGDKLFFLQGDLNDPGIRKQIKERGPFDLVVCDAAPLTTGNRIVDTARSEQLVEMAIWYGETMLKKRRKFLEIHCSFSALLIVKSLLTVAREAGNKAASVRYPSEFSTLTSICAPA